MNPEIIKFQNNLEGTVYQNLTYIKFVPIMLRGKIIL